MVDLNKIKVLAWDIGGTVFNWRGTIQKELETALARALLSGEIKEGQQVIASIVDGKISFDLKSPTLSTD